MNRTTKYTVTGMGVGLSIMGSSIAYKLLARMDIPAKPAIVRRFDDANITLARLKEMREELPYVTEDLTRDFPDVFSRDRITNLESATERVRGEINKMQGLPEITDYQEGVKKMKGGLLRNERKRFSWTSWRNYRNSWCNSFGNVGLASIWSLPKGTCRQG